MTDEADFLRAIIAAPDIDLPRLVYADWLEETAAVETCRRCRGYGQFFQGSMAQIRKCPDCHGTGSVLNGHAERAEFIRVQCKIAEHHRPGGRMLRLSEFEDLRRRERELLWQNRIGEWIPPGMGEFLCDNIQIGPRGDSTQPSFEFRRGFVESITCSWSDFRTHADAIMAATPLRRVRLAGAPPWDEAADFNYGEKITHPAYPGIEFEFLPQPIGIAASSDVVRDGTVLSGDDRTGRHPYRHDSGYIHPYRR